MPYFGIQTRSFGAKLTGSGAAIGLAWSGLLAGVAGVTFMLVLQLFKVGDSMTLVGKAKIFDEVIQNYSVVGVRPAERVAQLAKGVELIDAIDRLRACIPPWRGSRARQR